MLHLFLSQASLWASATRTVHLLTVSTDGVNSLVLLWMSRESLVYGVAVDTQFCYSLSTTLLLLRLLSSLTASSANNCGEVKPLVNERPARRKPSDPSEGSALCSLFPTRFSLFLHRETSLQALRTLLPILMTPNLTITYFVA